MTADEINGTNDHEWFTLTTKSGTESKKEIPEEYVVSNLVKFVSTGFLETEIAKFLTWYKLNNDNFYDGESPKDIAKEYLNRRITSGKIQ